MYPPFVTQKVEPKCAARRNLWGRRLSSVKRMLRTFEAIKRSPFLNPPTACRPISPNFAVRDRLTRGNSYHELILRAEIILNHAKGVKGTRPAIFGRRSDVKICVKKRRPFHEVKVRMHPF